MKDAFRQAGTVNEFFGELESISINQTDLLVWQTDVTGKRNKINAKITSYKNEAEQTLIVLSSPELDKLKKKLSYYIYDEKQGILFKGNWLRHEHHDAVLRADDNVFIREKRETQRLYFQYTKVFVDVKYGSKIDFHGVLLKDISEDGYGLLVTESMSKALLVGMELGITKLNSIDFPRPLNGKIVHRTILAQKDDPKQTKVKVGVKFNKRSKLIELVRKAMEEI